MTVFSGSDRRDQAGRRTAEFTGLLLECRDAVDAACGSLSWTEPEPARTYRNPSDEAPYFLSAKQWGRATPEGRPVGFDEATGAINDVLARHSFGTLRPWGDQGAGPLNATATRSDGVRLQYYGRSAHASFWVEVPPTAEADA